MFLELSDVRDETAHCFSAVVRGEDPRLIANAGHAVACHFWREIAPSAAVLPRAAIGPDPRLERLQSAFRS